MWEQFNLSSHSAFQASGAPGVDLRDRIHCHQGFTPKEDPGFKFVRDNTDIMDKLEKGSIAGLDVFEKIKVGDYS